MNDPFAKEKVYEALDFFSRNVNHAGKIKLFKLLYYLDLLTFRRTGQTVTGLRYEAWPMGPVPAELDQEFRNRTSELHRRFEVEASHQIERPPSDESADLDIGVFQIREADIQYVPTTIRGRTPYQHNYLTRREQQIAERLAEIFRDATAEEMTDISHGKTGPWRKAIIRGKREGVERPEVDLIEGEVSCGDRNEELSAQELKELVEERARLRQSLS